MNGNRLSNEISRWSDAHWRRVPRGNYFSNWFLSSSSRQLLSADAITLIAASFVFLSSESECSTFLSLNETGVSWYPATITAATIDINAWKKIEFLSQWEDTQRKRENQPHTHTDTIWSETGTSSKYMVTSMANDGETTRNDRDSNVDDFIFVSVCCMSWFDALFSSSSSGPRITQRTHFDICFCCISPRSLLCRCSTRETCQSMPAHYIRTAYTQTLITLYAYGNELCWIRRMNEYTNEMKKIIISYAGPLWLSITSAKEREEEKTKETNWMYFCRSVFGATNADT